MKKIIDEKLRKYHYVINDLYNLVKFHNPESLINIELDQLSDLAHGLKSQYTPDLVQKAFDQVKSSHADRSLTIGVFLEVCNSLQKSERNFLETQNKIAPYGKPRQSAKDAFNELKEQTKKAVKPLPYNKAFKYQNARLTEDERRQIEANPDRTQELIRDLISYGITLGLAKSLIYAHGEKHVRRSMIMYTRLGSQLLAEKKDYPCSMYEYIANHMCDTSDEAMLKYNQTMV